MSKQHTYLLLTCLCWIAGDTECIAAKPTKASERPHIIVIVADDLGYNDVSFHGSDQIPTPNIDFLGYNGIILNNYYVSPICSPTRSALMTGRHPIHTGLQHSVIAGGAPYGLPLNETLMPQYFNKLGYRSHMVGKWHLGMFKWDYTPINRGFESHLGYYQGCQDYYTHTFEYSLDYWGLDFRQDKELLWNYTGLYSTDIFRNEAVRIINQHDKSQPLFLYLPFQAVHSANKDDAHLQAPKAYLDKFKYIENTDRRTYAAMVSALDDSVGVIYNTLKQNGMLNNSIIVFTTDNGGPANGFDFNAANNFPLRGLKADMWEGGVRGVGFIHSPLLEKQGYVSEHMLHVCDWVPTLYSAAGGDTKDLKNLDGFDAWDMLSKNGTNVRDEILHNIDPVAVNAGIRVGDYKLLVGNIDKKYDKWFPPYQLSGDEQVLHVDNFNDSALERTQSLRRKLEQSYSNLWPQDVISRMRALQAFSIPKTSQQKNSGNQYDSTLKFISETWMGNRPPPQGTPVKVDCGPKPANASTNCQPELAACLYYIPSDPCEYNNIAAANPEVVVKLLDRLKYYTSTMVPPRNKPTDVNSNPRLHGGAWVPWQ